MFPIIIILVILVIYIFIRIRKSKNPLEKKNVLSREDCENLIRTANKYKFVNDHLDTIDGQPEYQIDVFRDNVVSHKELYDTCMELYNTKLPRCPKNLDLDYIFIRRYTPSERTGVPIHFDSTKLTYSILLSDTKDFEGGKIYAFDEKTSRKFDREGLDFMDNKQRGQYMDGRELPVIDDYEQGDVLIFEGQKLFHGITPVTGGARYIVTYFFE